MPQNNLKICENNNFFFAILSESAIAFCSAQKDSWVLDPLMVPLQFVT